MAKTLKYNIKKLYDERPRSVTNDYFESLLKRQGLSIRTFYRDCSIAKSSSSSVPIDRLEVYASLFSTTVDELKNYEAPKVKPLSKAKETPITKKLNLKTGLKVIGFIIAILITSCKAENFTCADYAQGKGSKNRNYANAYRHHFSHKDTSIKKITLPRI